jgi:hypothetical protein
LIASPRTQVVAPPVTRTGAVSRARVRPLLVSTTRTLPAPSAEKA